MYYLCDKSKDVIASSIISLANSVEEKDHVKGRAKLLLWKGMTNFMEGQDHFYGRARPLLWKGRMGLNSDLAIEKSLIPGMSITRSVHISLCM